MQVRQLILTASAFVMAGAGPAGAQESARVAGDSGLQSLVAEALARTRRSRSASKPFEPLRSGSDPPVRCPTPCCRWA